MVFMTLSKMTRNVQCDRKMVQCDMNVRNDASKMTQNCHKRQFFSTSDTDYPVVILVLVRVACCLFKLTQGVSLLVCSEMFALGKSTISKILRDVVHAINIVLRHEISFHWGPRILQLHQAAM